MRGTAFRRPLFYNRALALGEDLFGCVSSFTRKAEVNFDFSPCKSGPAQFCVGEFQRP